MNGVLLEGKFLVYNFCGRNEKTITCNNLPSKNKLLAGTPTTVIP